MWSLAVSLHSRFWNPDKRYPCLLPTLTFLPIKILLFALAGLTMRPSIREGVTDAISSGVVP
jgi:hypothetical protein